MKVAIASSDATYGELLREIKSCVSCLRPSMVSLNPE